MKKIQSLEGRLTALQAGERCWFWLCPASEELPLLIEKFSDPKGMQRLLRRASTLPLPLGAQVCTGIASVADDGTITFGSPLIGEGLLEQLAGWVRQHASEHPGLSLLSGAQLVHIDSAGSVQARYQDPSLWDGIERPHLPGTLGAARAVLEALAPGDDAWVWLSEGPAAPLVCALPISDDPEGEQLRALILSGRARNGTGSAGLRGVARKLASGGVLVTTADALDAVGAQLAGWLQELGEVRFAQLRDGEVVAARRIGGAPPGADLAAQVAALEAAGAGNDCVFWFTEADQSGEPLLLLEESRGALKSLVEEVGSDAASMRGQLVAAPWGLEFRTRKELPDFLPKLAGWVAAHSGRWPGLRALIGARMTRRDKAGEILARFKDDDAWAPLRAQRS